MIYKSASINKSMSKQGGLPGIIGILRDKKVEFHICLCEDADKEEVEAELRDNGVDTHKYCEKTRILSCRAAKEVYENVVNIPDYLEGKVREIGISK